MTILPGITPRALVNDGALELLFIGTGSAFARRRYQTNFLIIKGGAHILVDFGMTGVEALRAATGLDPTAIDTFLPTHSHSDHIGGLEYLTLLNRYVGVPILKRPKLRMIITREYKDVLWRMSLAGGMEWNENALGGGSLKFDDYYDVLHPDMRIVDGRPVYDITHEGIALELFRTNHIPDTAGDSSTAFLSHGLLIDGRVFVSGDTKFDRGLIDRYASRAEWLFHDAGLAPNPVHASLPELRTLPAAIKRKMFLMHYPDEAPDTPVDDFAGWTRQGVRYLF